MKNKVVKETAFKEKPTVIKRLSIIDNSKLLSEVSDLLSDDEHLVMCCRGGKHNVVLTNLRILLYTPTLIISYKYSSITSFACNIKKNIITIKCYGIEPIALHIADKKIINFYSALSANAL